MLPFKVVIKASLFRLLTKFCASLLKVEIDLEKGERTVDTLPNPDSFPLKFSKVSSKEEENSFKYCTTGAIFSSETNPSRRSLALKPIDKSFKATEPDCPCLDKFANDSPSLRSAVATLYI